MAGLQAGTDQGEDVHALGEDTLGRSLLLPLRRGHKHHRVPHALLGQKPLLRDVQHQRRPYPPEVFRRRRPGHTPWLCCGVALRGGPLLLLGLHGLAAPQGARREEDRVEGARQHGAVVEGDVDRPGHRGPEPEQQAGPQRHERQAQVRGAGVHQRRDEPGPGLRDGGGREQPPRQEQPHGAVRGEGGELRCRSRGHRPPR
mmetsp:Transcript_52920/g.149064  ORF Transcript_52920/g.149064 Transcript_52920/m.149064 type:complete len:201 (-) Transcript_52920:558-1160(-)